MMNTLTSVVKRHPIITFFALAYTFSWLPWVLGTLAPASRPFVLYPFFAAGPLLAALIVIPITQGRAGLRAWAARLLKWRVSPIWYAAAIGIPLTALLGAVALNVALGAPSRSLVDILGANGDAREFNGMLGIGPVLSLVLVFAIRLINPSDGPVGEEPGWRGFALPGLQRSVSPLSAGLIVGLLAAAWHLPIFLVGGASPLEILAPFGLGVVSSWLYNRSGGSTFLSIVLHAADGVFQIGSFGFAGADAERMVLLYVGLWLAMALGVVLVYGSNLGRQPDAQAEMQIAPVVTG